MTDYGYDPILQLESPKALEIRMLTCSDVVGFLVIVYTLYYTTDTYIAATAGCGMNGIYLFI
jgi:hypothetical protein